MSIFIDFMPINEKERLSPIFVIIENLPIESVVTDFEGDVIETPDKGIPSDLLTTIPEIIFC